MQANSTNSVAERTRAALSTMLLFALAIFPGCSSEPVKVPKAFVNYNAAEGTFACDAPDGWEIEGGGKRGPVWAHFTSGDAVIRIKANPNASLMADAMGGRTADAETPPELHPAHLIHEKYREDAELQYAGYTETPTSPSILDCKLGPARVSEFTSQGSFGGAQHGYRATILAHSMGVHVVCLCNEADWAALKPAFDTVLASMKRGVVE